MTKHLQDDEFNIEIYTPQQKYIPEEIKTEESNVDEEMILALSESKIFPETQVEK